MRFLNADYIFPVSSDPVRDGVLVVEDSGEIVDLLASRSGISESSQIETYRGIICPGFVNAHCHLELSYLKGRIEGGKGLAGFIHDLIPARIAGEEEIMHSAQLADAEMRSNGIVAVGDISNTSITIPIKKSSSIYYHSFIEIFDLEESWAYKAFDEGKKILDQFRQVSLPASLVPHAPYTVSSKLMSLISTLAYEENALLSIHNQETEGENEMFLSASGEFLERLTFISDSFRRWKATGFRSLPSVFAHLPKCNKIQFVHNTCSRAEDIRWAQLYNLFTWWCICPNANLFIENKLPDLPMLQREMAKITIGTDSYASNHSLSVFDEIKTLHRNFKSVSLIDSITWATLHGAEFLGIRNMYGSLEKGRRPGLNLITEVNSEKLELAETSLVRVLL